MLRQSLPLQHETLAQVAASWLAAHFYGQPTDIVAHYRAQLDGVTAETVGEAAARWLDPTRAVIVVVGPPSTSRRHSVTSARSKSCVPAPPRRPHRLRNRVFG